MKLDLTNNEYRACGKLAAYLLTISDRETHIEVRTNRSILPNHFWFGIRDE